MKKLTKAQYQALIEFIVTENHKSLKDKVWKHFKGFENISITLAKVLYVLKNPLHDYPKLNWCYPKVLLRNQKDEVKTRLYKILFT